MVLEACTPDAANVRKSQESRIKTSDRWFLIIVFFLYSLLLALLVVVASIDHAYWAVAGLILGLIYFAVSAYYFCDTFVRPYFTEHVPTPRHYRGIKLWSLEWIFPVAFIQLFIVLGFWISIARCPFYDTVYTHALHHSYLYESMLAQNKFELQLKQNEYKAILKGETREGPAQEASDPAKVPASYIDLNSLKKKDERQVGLVDLLVGLFEPKPHSGDAEPDDKVLAERAIHKVPFLIAFSFGFLGSLIYSLFDIARRFYTADLLPKSLVGYVARFLISASVCVVVAYGMIAIEPDKTYFAFPLLFFFIGAFPERGLQWISSIAHKMLGQAEEKKPLSLANIDGMTDYMVYRFKEIGIEDIEHLAFADLNHLRKYLGFSERLLCDFVSQALLMIMAGSLYKELKDKYGIRDVVSFKEVMTVNAERIQDTSTNPQMLANLFYIVQNDTNIAERLKNIDGCIKACERQERVHLREAAN